MADQLQPGKHPGDGPRRALCVIAQPRLRHLRRLGFLVPQSPHELVQNVTHQVRSLLPAPHMRCAVRLRAASLQDPIQVGPPAAQNVSAEPTLDSHELPVGVPAHYINILAGGK